MHHSGYRLYFSEKPWKDNYYTESIFGYIFDTVSNSALVWRFLDYDDPKNMTMITLETGFTWDDLYLAKKQMNSSQGHFFKMLGIIWLPVFFFFG